MDINNFVDKLAGTAVQPVLDDKLWTYFGYKKRPKRGSIFSKLLPKKYELEDYITKQVLIMSLVDIIHNIDKSTASEKEKLLLSTGLVDRVIKVTKHLFDPDEFVEELVVAYNDYIKTSGKDIHIPVITKAKSELNKENFAKFMVGITYIFSEQQLDYYFVENKQIMDEINSIDKLENKLSISASSDKYAEVFLKKVFRA